MAEGDAATPEQGPSLDCRTPSLTFASEISESWFSLGMTLWIFNHYAETPDGSATRTFELCRALVTRGHRVTIFACSFSHYRLREEHLQHWQISKTEERSGVRFIWLYGPSYSKNNWRRIANMFSYSCLAAIAGMCQSPRPDSIVGCSVHPGAGAAALLVAYLRGSRFFIEVPDLWPQVLIDFGRIHGNGVAARALRLIEKVFYEKAERIIMLWRNTEDYVESRGVPVDKLVWIPHVATEAILTPPENQFYEGQSKFSFMYLGSFVQSTALEVLLDAAYIVQQKGQKHIRFILIGGGVDRRRIMDKAQKMRLANMEIREPVSKKEISKAMQAADCFVCCIKRSPVYRYGVSMNKLCDYLMSGKPIVFSGESAYDPVSEAGAGISVPAENPEALARAVIRMTSLSSDERREMGQRGLAWARQHHSVEVLADRLEDLITNSNHAESRQS